LWDEAGVARSPSEVVAARPAALQAAAARLDAGAGTVWTGDNREGWHGGAEYVRLVAGEEADGDTAFFAEHCDTVRVMPYLEGIPCSIHALVLPDGEIALRPCEMIVFRSPGSDRFRYAGMATWWEPAPADREEMRAAALSVAAVLRDRVGYRGALGIDGVMTADGFRPTELNPRTSPGFVIQGLGPEPPVPLGHLSRMLVAGEEADYRGADLERLVLANAVRHPQVRSLTPIDEGPQETVSVPIAMDGDDIAVVGEEAAHGTLEIGPATMGGAVILRIDPAHARRGPSAAPVVAAAFQLADELWQAGIGPLLPASKAR
jgi:hypothetical protein